MEKKTPLYDFHEKAGGKIVNFGGYLLPIHYKTGIAAEHMAVRTAAGMFDVSHMGEVLIEGRDSLENIQRLVTNDCSNMYDGQVKYSPMCNESGGVIDDLLIYKKSDISYMLVVNASNHDKDVNWIKSKLNGDVVLTDISESTALIALQGPNSQEIISKLIEIEKLPQKYYTFVQDIEICGVKALISRTGYTGEDGFELYVAWEDAEKVWEALEEAGSNLGLIPCGLGARDTLRLEAAMPLYGHEMDEDIDPITVGLKMFVKTSKDFYGCNRLKDFTPSKKRVGIVLTDKGIAREGSVIYADQQEVGIVTSGTLCPYVNKAIAMARVNADIQIGQELIVDVRGRKLKAEVVKLPFYKREEKK